MSHADLPSVATVSRQPAGTLPAARATIATNERRFRFDLQGLRAISIVVVVGYHLRPNYLPGGFAGVDVFFVISGYLMTAQLVGEAQRSGRISMTQFWARRIRRLLPASFLVLAVTLVGSLIWIPHNKIADSLREIAASAFYVENLFIGGFTTVQHYWSLSVEEQFYIGLPILLVGGLAIAGFLRRRARRNPERFESPYKVAMVMLGIVFIASFAFDLALSVSWYQLTFFNTLAKAWEFAVGGMVGIVMTGGPRVMALAATRRGAVVFRVMAWLGVAIIGATAFLDSGDPTLPAFRFGVPVLGAVLAVLGGADQGRGSVTWVSRWRPIQFTGDISYGIYLWHWPLIGLIVFATGVTISPVWSVAVVAASVVLAWLSKRFVEDPIRRGEWWTQRRWPAFTFAAVGAVLIAGACGIAALVIL